jgi:hypothetical protein
MRKRLRMFLRSATAMLAMLMSAPAPAQTFTQLQFPSAGQRLSGIKAADVNNDGKLDLIVISEPNDPSPSCAGNPNGNNSRDLVVHLGRGDGSFGSPTLLHSQSCWGSDSVVEVEVVDVNKDAKPDLVYAGGDTLGIMLGNGDGTFDAPNLFHAVMLDPTNGDLVNSLGMADFNNDGNLDFVVSTTQYLQIFYGNGDGTVSDPALLDTGVDTSVGTFGGTIPGNFDVEAGDFNHDGNADIAFVWCCDPWEQTNRLYAWFGDGHGNFPWPSFIAYLGTSSFGGSLNIVDINGDGFADVVGAIDYGPSIFLYTENLTFAPTYASTQNGSSSTMSWGDFNGDGVLDLMSAQNCGSTPGCTPGVLIWPRTTGNSILTPQKVGIDAPGGVGDVIPGDFNGDGKPDIAAVVDLNQIAVLTNDASNSSPPTADTSAPDTVISSSFDGNGAALPNGGKTLAIAVNFVFFGTDNVGIVGFECRLDAAAFTACSSPASYSSLAVGGHSFEVRALDAAGNRDSTPARWSFLSDAPPETAIASAVDGAGAPLANGAATLSNAVTFAFSGSDNIGVARFDCRLDASTFAVCASPATYSNLALGRHDFAARAVDTSGFVDATPATFTLTVDAAPETTILSATDNTGRTVTNGGSMRGSSITFHFSGKDNDAIAGFECSQDSAAFAQCASPVTYSLTAGTHSFRVRAVDNAGFRDATAATFTWTK